MSQAQTGSARRRDAIALFSFVVELSIWQMNECHSLWEMWASKSDQPLVSDEADASRGKVFLRESCGGIMLIMKKPTIGLCALWFINLQHDNIDSSVGGFNWKKTREKFHQPFESK